MDNLFAPIIDLLHLLGIDDTAGPWYAFWSGFGSDIGEFAYPILGFLWFRRHFQCHDPHCTRWLTKSHHGAHYCWEHAPQGAAG